MLGNCAFEVLAKRTPTACAGSRTGKQECQTTVKKSRITGLHGTSICLRCFLWLQPVRAEVHAILVSRTMKGQRATYGRCLAISASRAGQQHFHDHTKVPTSAVQTSCCWSYVLTSKHNRWNGLVKHSKTIAHHMASVGGRAARAAMGHFRRQPAWGRHWGLGGRAARTAMGHRHRREAWGHLRRLGVIEWARLYIG